MSRSDLRIIGIDPGANGAVAVLWEDGRESVTALGGDCTPLEIIEDALVGRTPGDAALRVVCYLEEVGGYVGKPQPGSRMFKFGRSLGRLEGILAALRVRTVLVKPQAWQKGIPALAGISGKARKRALREHALRLFPVLRPTLDTADALLIAEYGRRQEP